jgi:hypothetical protein
MGETMPLNIFRGFLATGTFYGSDMDEKDKLSELLKAWQAPEPRGDFEAAVMSRLHSQPEPASLWNRWFVEPWEYAASAWRQPILATVGAAALALVLGVSIVALQGTRQSDRGDLASLRLDVFHAAPRSSITGSYLEAMER